MRPAPLRFNRLPILLTLGCASTTVTTTVLPPQRLEDPICPTAVIIADNPADIPPGGRILARLRVEGGDLRKRGYRDCCDTSRLSH